MFSSVVEVWAHKQRVCSSSLGHYRLLFSEVNGLIWLSHSSVWYLQAGGPIEHSLSQWQYRTPTTNQWTFQTSSNGWEKVAKQVSNCSKIHSILKINFYHQRCPYEAYFRLSVSGMPNDFWEFDMTLMKVSSNKNLEYVAHDYISEYYYSGAQAKS